MLYTAVVKKNTKISPIIQKKKLTQTEGKIPNTSQTS